MSSVWFKPHSCRRLGRLFCKHRGTFAGLWPVRSETTVHSRGVCLDHAFRNPFYALRMRGGFQALVDPAPASARTSSLPRKRVKVLSLMDRLKQTFGDGRAVLVQPPIASLMSCGPCERASTSLRTTSSCLQDVLVSSRRPSDSWTCPLTASNSAIGSDWHGRLRNFRTTGSVDPNASGHVAQAHGRSRSQLH